MKKIAVIFLLIPVMAGLCSCNHATGSDTYDAVWSPTGNSVTVWTIPSSSDNKFTQTDGGFQYAVTLADSVKYDMVVYSFAVTPYHITDFNTASSGSLSFTTHVWADSVQLSDSSKIAYRFADVSGSVTTIGSDTSMHATKAFFGEATNAFPLSVAPDSCSSMIKLNLKIIWRNYTGSTPLKPLPHSRLITIEISDLTWQINKINVLR
jgi:hypothetical protein